ncbi:WD40 repeat-like protein [Auriscalpium vulgare]|uniref:WD40 repeat-like protein n=1 Tax=Auriscalpium vulgare TaxID=40419 RepID=A0ACB8SBD8_9AGAM|nr:WD40 repeat-like protein [Auriscalpium vulgare]
MNSTPLVVPFTFPNGTSSPGADASTQGLLAEAYSRARPTCLASWGKGLGPDPFPGPLSGLDDPSEGVAVGCEDGTIYIFNQAVRDGPLDLLEITPSRPSSPPHTHRHGRTHSRSATPSALSPNFAPFNISSRTRAVSAVSNEQAQAPKNYVDFDEEPERLKEMLKGGVREKSVTDRIMPSFEKGFAFDKVPPPPSIPSSPSPPGHTRKSDARSLLSAAHSPAHTSKSLSGPPSPALVPSLAASPYPLSLDFHVFPPHFGTGYAVADLKPLNSGGHVLCLQSHGSLSVFCVRDGTCRLTSQFSAEPLSPPPGMKEVHLPKTGWIWKRLELVDTGELTLVAAFAALDERMVPPASLDSSDNERQHSSRISLLALRASSELDSGEMAVEKIGDWLVHAQVDGLGVRAQSEASLQLYYVDSSNHFITRSLLVDPDPPVEEDAPEENAGNLAIPLLNAFKTGHIHSKERLSIVEKDETRGRVELGEPTDHGILLSEPAFLDLRVAPGLQMRGAIWSDHELCVFDWDDQKIGLQFTATISGLKDVTWHDNEIFSAVFPDRVDIYKLSLVDANNDRIPDQQAGALLHAEIVSSAFVRGSHALRASSPTHVVSASVNHEGRRKLEIIRTVAHHDNPGGGATLWKAREQKPRPAGDKHITCMLPLELAQIILGYSDGTLRLSSFLRLSQTDIDPTIEVVSDVPLNGCILSLHVVQNDRTGDRLIIGGADDGSVAIWSLESLKLLARWIPFISPLRDVVQLKQDKGGPFRGSVLAASCDGTIAVITMDEYQFSYIIPGAQAPLSRICLGGDNLLLIYAHDRARLWDAKTTEFWRSMSLDKAHEMLEQGGWVEVPIDNNFPSMQTGVAPLGSSLSSYDAATSLLVDLEPFLSRAVSIAKALSNEEGKDAGLPPTVGVLRAMLAALLTPGINSGIDSICKNGLQLLFSSASVGYHHNDANSLIAMSNAQAPWCVSADVSAARALAIVACLRTLNHFDNATDDFNTVIAFYATSLPHAIGDPYVAPSLPFLAKWWFDTSGELRAAARTLFDAGVAGLSPEATIAMVEHWQHQLPNVQPDDSAKKSPSAAKALLLCGFVATHQYNLLSTSSLSSISKSIVIYLHEEDVICKALAIDLCSRGFDIWQHYVDAMSVLRSLFALATSSRKENISAQNIGPQARAAVLQVVQNNTALFMATLSMDILHPQGVEHRKSVLQLVAFLIRKKPLVIYPNLPRLVEAVVKSLDPNSTSNREAVLDTATEILGHVVKTFPTVDFHMASQRLAVGTGEGAVIMYDLKTATRLYVLESHKKTPTACSFSPDGRRLITVSLEEGVVLVWKVGSSFSSFFNPGAPPRQGHGGSEPYKSLGFNVGDEANMSVEDSLEAVRFEWPSERSVRLKIRGVTLTFST